MKISPRIAMQIMTMVKAPDSITEDQVKGLLQHFGVTFEAYELPPDPQAIVAELENIGTVAIEPESKVVRMTATLQGKAKATVLIVLGGTEEVLKLMPGRIQ